MSKTQVTSKLTLKGQIAEIVEEQGKAQIKVLIDPFYLTLKDTPNLHLGDKVKVNGILQVERIKQEFQPNGAIEL
ncbi:MAG: hypothetical protein HW374_137 [Bacteroidetes bacterium]|nr:hypothetical protein [Bacteroidota bacterium]